MELGNNWREIAKVVVTYKDGRRRVLPEQEVKWRFPIKPQLPDALRRRMRKEKMSRLAQKDRPKAHALSRSHKATIDKVLLARLQQQQSMRGVAKIFSAMASENTVRAYINARLPTLLSPTRS